MGGGNRGHPSFLSPCTGLSPRGRGKLRSRAAAVGSRRSIPAWAGETSIRASTITLIKVYPRVGGGNADLALFAAVAGGLSPRGRGKPHGSDAIQR